MLGGFEPARVQLLTGTPGEKPAVALSVAPRCLPLGPLLEGEEVTGDHVAGPEKAPEEGGWAGGVRGKSTEWRGLPTDGAVPMTVPCQSGRRGLPGDGAGRERVAPRSVRNRAGTRGAALGAWRGAVAAQRRHRAQWAAFHRTLGAAVQGTGPTSVHAGSQGILGVVVFRRSAARQP